MEKLIFFVKNVCSGKNSSCKFCTETVGYWFYRFLTNFCTGNCTFSGFFCTFWDLGKTEGFFGSNPKVQPRFASSMCYKNRPQKTPKIPKMHIFCKFRKFRVFGDFSGFFGPRKLPLFLWIFIKQHKIEDLHFLKKNAKKTRAFFSCFFREISGFFPNANTTPFIIKIGCTLGSDPRNFGGKSGNFTNVKIVKFCIFGKIHNFFL
jgi:hypothetical protein